MRTDATKEEWVQLYDLAIQLKVMKPWNVLKRNDIIKFSFSPEETGYFNVIEENGSIECFLTFGDMGLNDLIGYLYSQELEFDKEYMYKEINGIQMYIGSRQELSQEQYKVIKDLGLKFRGKESWIGFETHDKGFFPCLPERQEILQMTKFLEPLLDALKEIVLESCQINTQEGEIFQYRKEGLAWKLSTVKMDRDYQIETVLLDNEEQLDLLKKAGERKREQILEIDIFYLDNPLSEPQYDKPCNPKMAVMAECKTGEIQNYQILLPEESVKYVPSVMLCDWIMEFGAPARIRIQNSYLKASLDFICEQLQIPIEICRLDIIESFREGITENGLGNLTDDVSEPVEDIFTEFIQAAGLDLEQVKEMADDMSLEEFTQIMAEQFYENNGDTDFANLLQMNAEAYQEIVLLTRKKKYEFLDDFFHKEEESERGFLIEYSDRSWLECLMEGKKEDLLLIAEKAGASINKGAAKRLLAETILKKIAVQRDSFSECLSQDAEALYEFLCGEVDEYGGSDLEWEDFPYTEAPVKELLALGLIDMKAARNYDGILLEIYLVKEAADTQ